ARESGSLPSADEIIAKMINALGGEASLRAHSHRALRGTAEMIGLPLEGEFMQKASAPDKSLIAMQLGDLLVRQGFGGEAAWSDSPMSGRQILKGSAAEAMKLQAQFYGPLEMRKAYREIVPLGFATWDGKECIELKLTSASGATSHMYVDAATFLNAGTKANMPTPIGEVEMRTYLRHYRGFEGFLTATEIYVDSSVQRQLIRIDAVSFEPIAAAEYAPPL
ncbi:MAG TPA: hypothetical protein VF551_05495, partial [Chthoniobacterales bacterium]